MNEPPLSARAENDGSALIKTAAAKTIVRMPATRTKRFLDAVVAERAFILIYSSVSIVKKNMEGIHYFSAYKYKALTLRDQLHSRQLKLTRLACDG